VGNVARVLIGKTCGQGNSRSIGDRSPRDPLVQSTFLLSLHPAEALPKP